MSELLQRILSPAGLRAAFERCRRNGGGPGLDGQTLDDFAADLELHLDTLVRQVGRGDYRPLPAVTVEVPKRHDPRERRPISLLAVRDRVLQCSIARELTRVIDPRLHPSSYAYRPGRGTLDAVRALERALPERPWIVDADIRGFFDNLDHQVLLDQLAQLVPDPALLRLVEQALCADQIQDGLPRPPARGVLQGSPLSPLLANVYLDPFDRHLESSGRCSIRYADDFVVLDPDEPRARQSLRLVRRFLDTPLKLELKEEKTSVRHLSAGLEFLGFEFDPAGRRPSARALDRLQQILHGGGPPGLSAEEKEQRRRQHAGKRGWYNYYYFDRGWDDEPEEGRYEAAQLCYIAEQAAQDAGRARELIASFEAAGRLDASAVREVAELYHELGQPHEALARLRWIVREDPASPAAWRRLAELALEQQEAEEALAALQELVELEPSDAWARDRLAALYRERGLESLARRLDPPADAPQAVPDEPDTRLAELLLERFRGRDDCYAEQSVGPSGRTTYLAVDSPLTAEVLESHLRGDRTVALELVRQDGTAFALVLGLDLSRRLVEAPPGHELAGRRAAAMDALAAHAAELAGLLAESGLPALVADSGHRGRHVWTFFREPRPLDEIERLGRALLDRLGHPPDHVAREVAPRAGDLPRLRRVKLPLGRDQRTGRWCPLLDPKGDPLRDPASRLQQLVPADSVRLFKALQRVGGSPESAPAFELPTPGLRALYEGCPVLRAVCGLAHQRRGLQHHERVFLQYSAAQLGRAGEEFVHQVLQRCHDYNPRELDRFLRRRKALPMSCPRIRELIPHVTAEVDCSCRFRTGKKSYPNPLLHAARNFRSDRFDGRTYEEPAAEPAPEFAGPLPPQRNKPRAAHPPAPASPVAPAADPPTPAADPLAPEAAPPAVADLIERWRTLRRELDQVRRRLEQITQRLAAHAASDGSVELPGGRLLPVRRSYDLQVWTQEIE